MAYTLVPTELIVDGAITSAKLDTNIAISGTLGVTGEVTLATHLVMGDNDKIKIGTGGDLEIYHDGSNSYISNSTGNLYLGDTNGSVHIQAKLNEESIICAADGAVTLYHDNSSKLATTSTGIDVTGTATVDGLTVDGSALVRSGNTLTLNRTDNAIGGAMSYVAGTGFIFNDANGDGTSFNVGVANRMRIDASGNVGIGTTSPSAKLEINGDINIGTNAILSNGTLTVSAGSGAGYSTQISTAYSFPYVNTQIDAIAGASYSGQILFRTSSGGGSVSERMRIDSSGNVGIGTSSPTAKLDVTGDGTWIRHSGYGQLLDMGNWTDGLVRIESTGAPMYIRAAGSNYIALDTNSVERIRIDSGGKVGIGSGSPASYNSAAQNLVIKNTGNVGITIAAEGGGDSTLMFADGTGGTAGYRGRVAYTHAADRMEFHTAAAERMRIDSSGRLLVGTAAGSFGARITAESTTSYTFESRRTGTGNEGHIVFKNANGAVGTIFTNGSTTAYNTSSDYRLKENIIEITGAIDRVNQLQPKRFNFIADADTTVDGFLAHEVQDIIPEAVTGEKDAVDDEGNPHYQGIDQSKLVPLLTKAIQEQQTIIDDLKSRIETLEG